MKKHMMIIAIVFMIFSCEKNEKICNCDNPLTDLAWLNNLKSSITNCTCRMSIVQANYNKQTVFYVIMNDPVCDGVININLFDCKGEFVKNYQSLDQTFSSEVTNQKIIYTCKTSI
jgi:hypothetical protein